MGRRAVETLLGLMEGRQVPESVVMPIDFVRRRSCGCPDLTYSVAAAAREFAPKADEAILRDLWSRFVAEIHNAESGPFLSILDCELEKAEANGTDATDLLRFLTAIQRATSQWKEALPCESRLKAGELWGRAQEAVTSAIKRQKARRQVRFTMRHSILRMLNEKLGSTHLLEEQMDIVSRHLARLGIPGCYIALYTRPDEPTGEAHLILAFDGERRLPLPSGGLPFPAPDLVPRFADRSAEGERKRRDLSRLVLALYYGREKIGFVVFDIEGKEDASLCEILRWQLSGALKNAADIRAANAVAEEKAALLKELQHRVKNSMSLIASLSRIESAGASQPETKEALESLETRITAVGDLYEVLYDSGGIESVDLSDYLARVMDSVTVSVGGGPGRIEFDRSFEHYPMDLKRAVSLGLIVNELITDSLKHAFPEGRTGRVSVVLAREGENLVLEVGDDGIGYPPGFVPEEAEGFGLRMVSLLVKQLDGILSFETGGIGVRARLRLPC
jgi:two-component sensor histidine kinase